MIDRPAYHTFSCENSEIQILYFLQFSAELFETYAPINGKPQIEFFNQQCSAEKWIFIENDLTFKD